MTIDNQQTQMLISFFWWQIVLCTILAVIIGELFIRLIKRFSRMFNVPRKIRTQEGWLYRADNGFYVHKDLLEKLNAEYMVKNK